MGDSGGRNVTIRNKLVQDSGSSPETVSTCLGKADGCISRLANDGITVLAWNPAIPPTITVTGNRTVGNASHGIHAPGVTDGGSEHRLGQRRLTRLCRGDVRRPHRQATVPRRPSRPPVRRGDRLAGLARDHDRFPGWHLPPTPKSQCRDRPPPRSCAAKPANHPPEVSARSTDVPTDRPFRNEIGWLVIEGIANGFDDGTFRPTDPVSRQAMAAFLHRATTE